MSIHAGGRFFLSYDARLTDPFPDPDLLPSITQEHRARALWNLRYWRSDDGVPDPLADGGWIERGGVYLSAPVKRPRAKT